MYQRNMKQISVAMSDAQQAGLKVLAAAGHRSMASVIREIVAHELAKKQPPKAEA